MKDPLDHRIALDFYIDRLVIPSESRSNLYMALYELAEEHRWGCLMQHKAVGESARHPLELFREDVFSRTGQDIKRAVSIFERVELKHSPDGKLNNGSIGYIDRQIAAFSSETFLPDSKIDESYWGLHRPEYVQRLEGLIGDKTLPESAIAVVALPAMNESNLERAIDALASSYGKGFEKDIAIVLYHNHFKGKQVPSHVRRSVDSVSSRPNVMLIDEDVPDYNRTGSAKKVVSDLVMMLERGRKELPLVMMDADVTYLTPFMIQDAIASLRRPGVLAASPEFDYDRSHVKDYPVLNLIWDLRREISLDQSRLAPNYGTTTYGMFYVTMPRTLKLVGGIKPHEQFEDSQFKRELDRFAQSAYASDHGGEPGRHPAIYSLGLDGHIVYVDPSRELDSLSSGKLQFSRWIDSREHFDSTSKERGRIPIDQGQDIPEFGEMTGRNIAYAINRAKPFMLPEVPGIIMRQDIDVLAFRSAQVYRTLIRQGIRITDADVRSFDINTPPPFSDFEYYYAGGKYIISAVQDVSMLIPL